MELATSSISGTQLNYLSAKILTAPMFHSFKYPQSTGYLSFHSPVPRPFSNDFICRGSSFSFINNINSRSNYNNNIINKIYTRLDSCLVIPPSGNKKPRAIIKFLGGAFLGAVPEVTYSYLLELLAKEGFLIISVPYNVTFDHEQAANQVYERFSACLDNFLAFGFPDANLTPADLVNLPIFSVGHSNGALLQVLTGSYFSEKLPKANAIISYNNRPATEAVPYFEELGPLVRQMMPMVEASPVYSMVRSASDDAWKMFIDTAGAMIADRDQEALVSFTKFVDQLPLVFGQVTEGIAEFKPTPSENRERCKNKYNIQHTLLVKFNFDAIDETDLLEETLKPRVESIGGTLEKVQLSGNHITPCAQEPKWQVGYVYTPADAIAQGLKTLSLNDTRVLSRTISDWFRRFED
ncbi:Eukaryotic initiation factor 4F subunit p150 isoform 1 [Theobroma cacao]|uniref:Eukaryotic initiation factor 4F subunit p150 isoform 1 n=1 Tax=Theobroma cacao TaxID=3641 RepID=A0A061GSK1_THECC|nr:Eukaryotic initiation factor 4F subunit p150 isoform 1 [Theobroma cacao]